MRISWDKEDIGSNFLVGLSFIFIDPIYFLVSVDWDSERIILGGGGEWDKMKVIVEFDNKSYVTWKIGVHSRGQPEGSLFVS